MVRACLFSSNSAAAKLCMPRSPKHSMRSSMMVRICAIAHFIDRKAALARLRRDTAASISRSRVSLGARHAVVLAQLRCPAAVADFVSLSWIVQPCPEACEPKPRRWSHVIMDKHFVSRHRLRHVEDVFHMTLLMGFSCARAWRYNA